MAHLSVVRRLLLGHFEYAEHGTTERIHLRWFTRRSLRDTLEERGLTLEEITMVPQVPYLPSDGRLAVAARGLLIRSLPDLLGGSRVARAARPVP